jgi:hypothetical protein
MTRIAVPLSILAIALLAGCGSRPATTARAPEAAPKPGAVAQEMPYRAGSGVVQSVSNPPTLASAGASAAPAKGASAPSAGASAPSDSGLQRLAIKMDDGRMQYVDTPSRDFPVGTRVRLTENRQIEKQ